MSRKAYWLTLFHTICFPLQNKHFPIFFCADILPTAIRMGNLSKMAGSGLGYQLCFACSTLYATALEFFIPCMPLLIEFFMPCMPLL